MYFALAGRPEQDRLRQGSGARPADISKAERLIYPNRKHGGNACPGPVFSRPVLSGILSWLRALGKPGCPGSPEPITGSGQPSFRLVEYPQFPYCRVRVSGFQLSRRDRPAGPVRWRQGLSGFTEGTDLACSSLLPRSGRDAVQLPPGAGPGRSASWNGTPVWGSRWRVGRNTCKGEKTRGCAVPGRKNTHDN